MILQVETLVLSILNGNGELIGLAFDGNSEALSGDIVFEKTMAKKPST